MSTKRVRMNEEENNDIAVGGEQIITDKEQKIAEFIDANGFSPLITDIFWVNVMLYKQTYETGRSNFPLVTGNGQTLMAYSSSILASRRDWYDKQPVEIRNWVAANRSNMELLPTYALAGVATLILYTGLRLEDFQVHQILKTDPHQCFNEPKPVGIIEIRNTGPPMVDIFASEHNLTELATNWGLTINDLPDIVPQLVGIGNLLKMLLWGYNLRIV